MDTATVPDSARAPVVFEDPLGERRRMLGSTAAEMLEVLHLRGELTMVPSFETALRDRVRRLAEFRHIGYSQVRGVVRASEPEAALTLVSECTPGVRLSEALAVAGEQPLDINASLRVIRQLVSAIAVLHEHAPDAAHGAIGPERLVMTPNGRLVIVEYVMGAALEELRFSHERFWKELRIPVPRSTGLPRFDQRADITQIGVVALSLVLGRLLHEDEYPSKLAEVLASAWAISARGGFEPLPPGLRSWLARALQLDPRHSFTSALDARAELDKVRSEDARKEPETRPAAIAYPERGREAPAPPVAPVVAPVPVTVAEASIAAIVEKSIAAFAEAPTAASPAVPAVTMEMRTPSRRRWGVPAAVAAALIVLGAAGIPVARRYTAPPASVVVTGTLNVNSDPPGARVTVDGDDRGATPLTLSLSAGVHVLQVRGDGEPRTIPLAISPGAQVSHHIELPKSASAFGLLQVRTEPPGARVSVNGQLRGVSPITIDNLPPGEHAVVLESDLGSVKQTVLVQAGTTASLVVPLTTSGPAALSGWIAVSAPVDVQLYENGRLLGTSQSDRIMVSAGRHDIEIVNEPLGYRVTRNVQVAPGKLATLKLDWPIGTIALNAIPWAEVWIDGEKVGDTPVGNVRVAIGPHEIVFRHPELGEQRHAMTVSLKAPARLSVDMRKK